MAKKTAPEKEKKTTKTLEKEKKTPKKNKKKREPLPDNVLPQNILPMGEHVEENKNIYLTQSVYKKIHKFTKNKTTNESGGVLVGNVLEEMGKTNILISGFIEAKDCEATPTTLTFTHASWEHIHQEMEKKFPGKKILGWIHTHPDFGIFLSEYDKFIHENFFSEENQIAYVIDPIQGIEGFYFWINGKLEKCKGFYIYDRMGVAIELNGEKETEPEKEGSLFSVRNLLTAALAVAVVFLIFSNISLHSELKELRQRQDNLESSANQVLTLLQQRVGILEALLSEVLTEEEQPETTENEASAPQEDGGAQSQDETEATNEQ